MKIIAWFLFVMLAAARLDALTSKEAETIYRADKDKVISGDLSFDWQQFRLAAKQGGTEYFDWHPLRNSFMQKMKDGNPAAALKDAEIIIGHNMAEPEGHLLAMMAYRELNKADDAAFQRKIVSAWVDSLQRSGDGKSPATAFQVVDVGEEYFYLNVVLGVGFPTSQSLVQREGHSFDLLKAKNSDGSERQIWFNVDVSMNALKVSLGSDK
jgi:hypothetical protein